MNKVLTTTTQATGVAPTRRTYEAWELAVECAPILHGPHTTFCKVLNHIRHLSFSNDDWSVTPWSLTAFAGLGARTFPSARCAGSPFRLSRSWTFLKRISSPFRSICVTLGSLLVELCGRQSMSGIPRISYSGKSTEVWLK